VELEKENNFRIMPCQVHYKTTIISQRMGKARIRVHGSYIWPNIATCHFLDIIIECTLRIISHRL
jgi:hypothetical protein